MKIVCISDTHSLHRKVKIPKCDMIIHAGDFTNCGSFQDYEDFCTWFSNIKCRYRILIAGNHDFIAYESPYFRDTIERDYSIIYLEDSWTKIEGLKIYGSPWSKTFQNWAFMLDGGAEIKTKWDRIPEDTDLLITHSPPCGHLDDIIMSNIPWHLGCEELNKAVQRIKPRYHIFGHIHNGYGIDKFGDTNLYNASICDEDYHPGNEPIIINI